MFEQSANDLNQIKSQLLDIEKQADLTGDKIQELDSRNKTLQEKVLEIENKVADSLENLAIMDVSLLAKINGIETNNDQNMHQLEDQIRSNNSATEEKLAEIDKGTQQDPCT